MLFKWSHKFAVQSHIHINGLIAIWHAIQRIPGIIIIPTYESLRKKFLKLTWLGVVFNYYGY